MSIETYITEFSKYVIALIAVFYSAVCLVYFLLKKEDSRRVVYLWQTILIFAFHFSSFMVICFETGDTGYLIFYLIQQAVIYAAMMLYKYLYPRASRFIVCNMCFLLSLSFVMLTRLDYGKALRQFIIASVSLAAALIIPLFVRSFKLLKNLKWIYAAVGAGLLLIVLVLGQTTYGSRISYKIAGVSFQPAEFVKIIFVFYVSSALYKAEGFFDIFTSAVVAGLYVVIQVVNRDLGSALIFFVIYICMLYVATGKLYYLILGLAAGSGAAYVSYRVFSHVRTRVIAFMDPFAVIDGAGYQITQSLFGISSGGLFGLGLFGGSPESIPFVEDDFIFSAIAEELGIIFAVCLILICLLTFAAIMKVSLSLKDKFYQLTAFGLGTAYIFQVFLTIGGGTKFIPLTGVTLPFISYGGSSMLTSVVMFAIIEGLFIIREDEIKEAKEKREKIKKAKAKKERAAKNRREKTKREAYYETEDLEEEIPVRKKPRPVREYEDDDLEFIHGFTREIEPPKEEDFPFEEIGEIYYNEEEYEKDRRIEENKEKEE